MYRVAKFFMATRRILMVGIVVGHGYAFGVEKAAHELDLVSQPFVFSDGASAPSYSLKLGQQSAADAIIFFISGSNCASVKYRLPAYFAPVREAINADLFALQKRGINEESKDEDACTRAFRETDHFDQTLKDQQEFINAKLAESTAASRAVVVIGASEGALVAAKIASEDSRVTHLGLIGSGGTSMRENLRILAANTWYLRNPDGGFADIAADPKNTKKMVWGQTYCFWSELLDVDVGALLLSLDIPIVMAMGEKDRSVPIGPAQALEARFVERGKQNFKLLIFPNANHRLEDVDSKRSCGKVFLTAVVASVNDAALRDEVREQSQSVADTRKSADRLGFSE
jgi:pimeloyl-ACP methyl ester carboxylesterase